MYLSRATIMVKYSFQQDRVVPERNVYCKTQWFVVMKIDTGGKYSNFFGVFLGTYSWSMVDLVSGVKREYVSLCHGLGNRTSVLHAWERIWGDIWTWLESGGF